MARFVPACAEAEVAAKPLFGAQQIPGDDPSLRASDVSFYGDGYARAEIIKASSALSSADAILQQLLAQGLVQAESIQKGINQHYFPVTLSCTEAQVTDLAMALSRERGYPEALGKKLYQPI